MDKLITEPNEIYRYLLNDPAFANMTSIREMGKANQVIITRVGGEKLIITGLKADDDELPVIQSFAWLKTT